MVATGVTVGLAEWIIDDTCLVTFIAREVTSFSQTSFLMTLSTRIPHMFAIIQREKSSLSLLIS